MWMILDFTIDNGATRLVSGSHLSGRQPNSTLSPKTYCAEGKAGSALIFEGRTWHAAGFNRSNESRYGITTYCTAPQFRQMANFTYGTRRDVVETWSPDLLNLLCFKPWGGYGATGDHAAEMILSGEQTTGELKPDEALRDQCVSERSAYVLRLLPLIYRFLFPGRDIRDLDGT